MKVWAIMYSVIWVSFVEILFVIFTPLSDDVTLEVHVPLGILVFALAFYVSRKVARTSCPERIKRITKTTTSLAVLQGVLGIALALAVVYKVGDVYVNAIDFLHIANSLAIITQASSSATAFDMWEEKEFQVPAPAPQSPQK
jgi:hypothetical protein